MQIVTPSSTPQQRPYHPCAQIMPTNTYPTQAQLQVHVHTLAYMPTPKTRVLATKPFQRLTSMKNQDIQNPWRLTRTPLARHRTPFTPPRARSPRTPPHAHPARPRALTPHALAHPRTPPHAHPAHPRTLTPRTPARPRALTPHGPARSPRTPPHAPAHSPRTPSHTPARSHRTPPHAHPAHPRTPPHCPARSPRTPPHTPAPPLPSHTPSPILCYVRYMSYQQHIKSVGCYLHKKKNIIPNAYEA